MLSSVSFDQIRTAAPTITTTGTTLRMSWRIFLVRRRCCLTTSMRCFTRSGTRTFCQKLGCMESGGLPFWAASGAAAASAAGVDS